MRALVTGASGFIGLPVVRALDAEGYDVQGASRSVPASPSPNIVWHRVNLLEPGSVDRLIQESKPDVLVHLAWEMTHGEFWDAPVNLRWTDVTLQLAREFAAGGGTRFVGLGSCAEYSWDNLNAGDPIRETSPRTPRTLYGAAKNECLEALSRFFGRGSSVSFAWGRLFLPYGPGDRRPTLIPELTRALLAGEPGLLTAGTQIRDFIYVDDAARAIAALAGTSVTGAFNIATGVGNSVADVAFRVATETGRPDLLRIGSLASRDGDPSWLVGCPQKITSETGWRPRVPLDEGIRETLRWWRASR
ncbi:MAG TPA: NAD(P)-dependent oxidoreductase [Bryobacteraceae bacterium]|jgi:nucleoside-diphosphate-sugar epimerase|nr:NAD(P)-dependent oxidoreductase [Bryobacteraceae bacterium]